MTPDFVSRLVGTIVFALIGARIGVDAATSLGLPPEQSAVIFTLVGVLVGLILTPWLTVRPLRMARHTVNEMPVDALLTALSGLGIGLVAGLLLSYPLSLLQGVAGDLLPAVVSIVCAYLGLTIFSVRSREILNFIAERDDE